MQTSVNEIFRVPDGMLVAGPPQRGRLYPMAGHQPLQPGYYFALRPVRVRSARFGRSVQYFGPFPNQVVAGVLRTSALALGIAEDTCDATPAPAREGAAKQTALHGRSSCRVEICAAP